MGFVGLLLVELICEQCSSVKNLGLEDVESITFLVFWVEGEKRCIPCARKHDVLEKYVISCKLKNVFLGVSLLPDGEGPMEGYKDV